MGFLPYIVCKFLFPKQQDHAEHFRNHTNGPTAHRCPHPDDQRGNQPTIGSRPGTDIPPVFHWSGAVAHFDFCQLHLGLLDQRVGKDAVHGILGGITAVRVGIGRPLHDAQFKKTDRWNPLYPYPISVWWKKQLMTMKEELERKSKELEQTLQMQLEVAKKESEEWVKIGAVALASGLLAFGLYRIFGKNKEKKKTKKVMETLAKEGLLDPEIKKKLTQKAEPGLLGRVGIALLPIALNYGKEQLLSKLQESATKKSDEPQK
jgi:hypothetical protein